MKQVGLVGGTMPSFAAIPLTGERGQPAIQVGPIIVVAEVSLDVCSSLLANRKRDNGIGVLGRKKSSAPLAFVH